MKVNLAQRSTTVQQTAKQHSDTRTIYTSLAGRQPESPSPSIPSELSRPTASRLSIEAKHAKLDKNGSMIGRDYTLISDLGEGTFGSVKLAKT